MADVDSKQRLNSNLPRRNKRREQRALKLQPKAQELAVVIVVRAAQMQLPLDLAVVVVAAAARRCVFVSLRQPALMK
jgi:hypothetical protein